MATTLARSLVVSSLLSLSLFGSLSLAEEVALPETQADPAGDRDRAFAEIAREVEALERQGSVLKRVVKLVKPSVVHIEARKGENEQGTGLGRRRPIDEAGSGVIFAHSGKWYVLTNRHVIKQAPLSGIKISLSDGRVMYPSKSWEDIGTDVAVLAVGERDLIPARIGDSDRIDIGDFVLAVGSPFGLSHSVTYGIISAKGRRDLQLGDDGVRFQDFLQTDAAVNPGNSGGPLLNLRGEVIGLNTAIASSSGGSEGIAFAIPANLAMYIAGQLIDRGSVSRAFLGVQLDSRFGPEAASRLGLAQPKGARVTGTTPQSPAEAAKLVVDDVVLEFNGTRVEDDSHLVNLVSHTPVGTEAAIIVFRQGKMMTLRVKVGDRSQFDPRP